MQRRFTFVSSLQSDTLGVISYNVGSDYPYAGPIHDWSAIQALYESYRVLRIRLRLVPLQAFTVTKTGGALAIGTYHGYSSLGLVQSFQNALESTGSRLVNILTPDTYEMSVRAGTNLSAAWQPTATSPAVDSVFGLTLRADGLSISTIYFTLIADYDIEFRNGC